MNTLMNRFRHAARKSSLRNDERGLSTVEYVIILVLIAAAAVGTWSKFGGTIMVKINAADKEVNDNVVISSDGSNGPAKSSQ